MAKSKDLVVGLFVLAGIAFCALVIFLLGDEKRLFETQMVLETSFVDVQGLKAGAPVRMGGIDIGTVEQVGFGEKAEDSNIYVRMSIVRSEARRIKTDSKARVQTRGLLGDKMIEITLGQDGGEIQDGAHLPSEVPKDVFSRVDEIAKKADVVMEDVQKVSNELANEELHQDIRETAASLNKIAKQVAEGEGYAGRFIRDPAEAERISREGGLEAFSRHERERAREPLSGGPFRGFLDALHRLQAAFPAGDAAPIRTALVTARSAPAHERVIRTLREWDVRLDEALFLGGRDKGPFLHAFGADIFFDDSPHNIDSARQYIAAGHVPHGVANP